MKKNNFTMVEVNVPVSGRDKNQDATSFMNKSHHATASMNKIIFTRREVPRTVP